MNSSKGKWAYGRPVDKLQALSGLFLSLSTITKDTSSFEIQQPVAQRHLAVLCVNVNLSERKQWSGPKGDKVCRTQTRFFDQKGFFLYLRN